ncbi:MAG: N-acetyltransferase [Armatimonadota bacterium]
MIRPYEPRDTEAILEIWYRASVIAHDFIPAEYWRAELENVRNTYLPLADTWVYEEEGEVRGFISLLESHVAALFVRPESQGQGIGRQLLQHARSLRGRLSLDVFTENVRSRAFYARCGFRETKESLHVPTGRLQVRMELE